MRPLVAKVIRDPLYGDIRLNFLEAAIMDHVAFQRLRRITQLAGAPFVYPAAVHTRFSHSLGTMNVAKLYADALELSPEDYLITALCALLHDVGHGPFSHCFEDAASSWLGMNHEQLGMSIMQLIGNTLLDQCPAKLLQGLKREAHIYGFDNARDYVQWAFEETISAVKNEDYRAHIVDGPMGADRLDFITRDAYFTGVSAFNTVDIFRLTGNALLVDGQLVYRAKVVDNIYGLTLGRFLMYKNVYYHKTSRAAELMMQLMITEAIEEGLLDGYRSVKEFSNLDEPTLLGLVKIKGGKSAQIYDQLLRRKLWKVVEERIVKAEQQSQTLEELYLLYAPCHIDVPEKLSLISPMDRGEVLILDEKGVVMPLSDYEEKTGYSLLQQEMNVFVRVYKEV